jgi:hypothetical protein
MGLKGYRLWDMGQLDSTCRAPPREAVGVGPERRQQERGEHVVAGGRPDGEHSRGDVGDEVRGHHAVGALQQRSQ